MSPSVFEDKNKHPADKDLIEKLSDTYLIWKDIIEHFYQHYTDVVEEWHYPGKNYGWSLRIKSKKRNIIYLVPYEGFFKFAFVFGKKALVIVMNSNVHASIKNELENARTYAEGTGFRMEVKDKSLLKDIKDLIAIKINN